jgi:hypothetical protein
MTNTGWHHVMSSMGTYSALERLRSTSWPDQWFFLRRQQLSAGNYLLFDAPGVELLQPVLVFVKTSDGFQG